MCVCVCVYDCARVIDVATSDSDWSLRYVMGLALRYSMALDASFGFQNLTRKLAWACDSMTYGV